MDTRDPKKRPSLPAKKGCQKKCINPLTRFPDKRAAKRFYPALEKASELLHEGKNATSEWSDRNLRFEQSSR